LKKAILIVASSSLVLLSGCSLLFAGKPSEVILESTEDLPGSERMPFTLKVGQEINDGKELHILGSVVANTEWNPAEVVVRLTSLKDGKPVGVVHHTLKKLIEARVGVGQMKAELISAGDETNFSLSVPSAGMSDYQLVLLWGEEAEQFLESKPKQKIDKETQASNGKSAGNGLKLRIHSIEVETLKSECPYPPCEVRFRLKAVLQNQGKSVITSAKLGVGFIATELLGSNMSPDEEEQVDVPNLKLLPGQSRPFRILLNQEMSEEIAEDVRPVLRIVSFEGE
jgi:hypothetical protein